GVSSAAAGVGVGCGGRSGLGAVLGLARLVGWGVGLRRRLDLGVVVGCFGVVRGGLGGPQGRVEGGLDVDLVPGLVGHLDPFGDYVRGLAAQHLGGREAELTAVGELLGQPVG